MGWCSDGRAIALKGLEHLADEGKSPRRQSPDSVHTLKPDGTVLDPLRNAYDHAFSATKHHRTGSIVTRKSVPKRSTRCAISSIRNCAPPHGGVHEGLPVSLPQQRESPLHLFEAMIAAFDATHDLVFQNRAGNFLGLFLANLYDKQRQVLGEYFEEDWSKIEPVSVEPGHQAEWAWLLKGFDAYRLPDRALSRRVVGVGTALSRRGDRLSGR